MTVNSASPETATPSRSQTAPLGIKALCVLSGMMSVIAAGLSFAIAGQGGAFVLLGLLVLVLSVAQVVVLIGLWTLQSWAWSWALVLYGLNVLLRFFQSDLLGAAISFVIIGYLVSKEEYYR
jgi:hypothetical protein